MRQRIEIENKMIDFGQYKEIQVKNRLDLLVEIMLDIRDLLSVKVN